MNVAGIDPGYTGHLVVLGPQRELVLHTPTPIVGTRAKPQDFDAGGMRAVLAEALRLSPHGLIVGLESPGAVTRVPYVDDATGQRKTRVIHATVLREGVRLWQGILVGMGVPYELLTPSQWQRTMHDGASPDLDPKDRSVLVAERLFPNLVLRHGRRKNPDHDLAEAALLADLMRRRHAAGGGTTPAASGGTTLAASGTAGAGGTSRATEASARGTLSLVGGAG